jgi:hypothetical protein
LGKFSEKEQLLTCAGGGCIIISADKKINHYE